MASALPVADGEKFDLVIISFVLMWVSRETMMKSLAEIDRVIPEKGYLIVNDHYPEAPTKRDYHHLPDKTVFTHKQDYANIFLSTSLYSLVARTTFDYVNLAHYNPLECTAANRCSCTILKKSFSDFYVVQD